MCYIPNNTNEDYIEKRYKEFAIYFQGLDRIGIPYGTGELTQKAKELGLPVPSHEIVEKWRTEVLERNNMETEKIGEK